MELSLSLSCTTQVILNQQTFGTIAQSTRDGMVPLAVVVLLSAPIPSCVGILRRETQR